MRPRFQPAFLIVSCWPYIFTLNHFRHLKSDTLSKLHYTAALIHEWISISGFIHIWGAANADEMNEWAMSKPMMATIVSSSLPTRYSTFFIWFFLLSKQPKAYSKRIFVATHVAINEFDLDDVRETEDLCDKKIKTQNVSILILTSIW